MPNQSADHIYSTPLDENQIRIVALQPGKENDTLECQIRLVDTRAEASYDAISYVWGSQDTTDVIKCITDGKDQQVDLSLTQNAADALRAVRLDDGVRLLWIDCLCISQTSTAEKAAQVGMMDNIFANATTVLIWLGADDRGHSVAAAEVAERIHECFEDELRVRIGHKKKIVSVKPVNPVVRQSCYDEVASVFPLFECEWFWRLWCVQEVALAKNPLMYWGSIVLTWEVVLTVAAFIESKAQLHVAHSGYAGVHNVIMLECLREQVRDWGVTRLPFSRLLSLTRLHGVTEPCDRIFSLLGLDRQLSMSSYEYINEQYADWLRNGDHTKNFSFHSMPATQPLVSPDYSEGIEGLYLSTARALLTRERNLHLLSFVQHEAQAGQGDLPSWVPQWHVNEHRLITQFDLLPDHPVHNFLRDAFARSTLHAELETCTTSKASEPDALVGEIPLEDFLVDDDGTLRTKGLLLATVAKCCSSARFTADIGEGWLECLRAWYRSVSEWLAQDCKSGLLDVTQDQLNDKVFRTFYGTLLGGHFRAKHVFFGLRTELESFQSSLRSGGTDKSEILPTTRAFVTQICRSRTLFFTDGGQLGIGPQCVEPGDCVCFLAGAAAPLLLRPCLDAVVEHRHWVLVGETYVNGLAGTSPDWEWAEELEALHFPKHDEQIPNFASLPSATPTDQSFLQTLDIARIDRSYAMFSNVKLKGDGWGGIHYSDLGKIEVKRSIRTQDPPAPLMSSGSAVGERPGAVDVRSYELVRFDIK